MNEKIVAARGEAHFVRSFDLIEGALSRPINLYQYEGVGDVFTLALRLLEGIGKNHCFEQGNKRTAHMAAMTFMIINGTPYDKPDTVENAKIVRRIITGLVSFDDALAWCHPGEPAA